MRRYRTGPKPVPSRGFEPTSDVVLGLDASLTGFGFCALGLGDPQTGEVLSKTVRYSSKQRGIFRLIDIRDWMVRELDEILATRSVSYVAMEGYAFGSEFNREAMGELGGVVRVALYERLSGGTTKAPAPCQIVPPKTLKKFATGNGNSKKDQVLLAVYKKWRVEVGSHDEADAYALARVAAAIVGLIAPTAEYEREVIERLTGQGADGSRTKRSGTRRRS